MKIKKEWGEQSTDDLVFTVKLASSQPILGIRMLAGLDGKDFDVCAGAAPGDNGQCETFSGSNTQQTYSLSQMVFGEYVTITVPDIGYWTSLNVCELEIVVDDCDATQAPTPASTGGPTPEPTAPAPTGGPTPEPTAPAPTGGPTPEPTAPAPTGGPTPEPTAPAPTGGPTPEPTAPAPTGGPTPEPTAPAPTGGPTPEPTAPAPTGGPTPDGSDQQPCDTDNAKDFFAAFLASLMDADGGTPTLSSDTFGCTVTDLKAQIAELVDGRKTELAANVAAFKAQIDASVNTFVAMDSSRIHTVVEAATSAASSHQLKDMSQRLLTAKLAGNTQMIESVVAAAMENGAQMGEVRSEMVNLLTGSAGKTAASQRLVDLGVGPQASFEKQKAFFDTIQTDALRKSQNVIGTATSLQMAFGTPKSLVEGAVANIIAASTGAAAIDAAELVGAAMNPNAGRAAALLLTGLSNPRDQEASGGLRAAVAAAKSNENIFADMKSTMASAFAPKLADVTERADNAKAKMLRDGMTSNINKSIGKILKDVETRQNSLKNSATQARQKVFSRSDARRLIPKSAIGGAADLAKQARQRASAGASKAFAANGGPRY